MWLGAHIGITDGLARAPVSGKEIGCEAIQIFSKSPQMWNGPAIDPEAANAFREAVRSSGLRATAVHHGYLINLGTPKAFLLRRSRAAFLDEVHRAELLGVDGLIFHPGAHLGKGTDPGLRTLAESLTQTLDAAPEGRVRLLLENAAGQGTALCSTLEELQQALARVDRPERVGVALDTCHLFAAGNDFRTPEGYGALMDRVEATVGRAAVRAFHLNDAKAPVGSHLDRHENIGKGEIGLEGFRQIVTDPRWTSTPGYLETPLDDRGLERYREDLTVLRSLRGEAAGPAEPAPADPARPRKPRTKRPE